MGVLGASVDGGCEAVKETFTKINERMDKGDLSLVQALCAASDGVDKLTPTLAAAANWAKFAAAASTVVGATVTLFGADAVGHFKKIAQEMSKSLKELCDAAEVSTNLLYEKEFPQWVFDFVSDQISVVSTGRDLEKTNNENLAPWTRALEDARSNRQDAENADVAHFYFVYHPATDWHAAFNIKMRESRLPGFVGCTNNLDALGAFLVRFRQVIGPDAVIHILLPSAHMYVIEEEVIVPAELQPIRFKGQIHRSGHPYVHASIRGLDATNIQDVGRLIRPNKLGAWDKVGAAAGGIGAGVAGGLVGGAGLWGVGVAAFLLAGPVAIPFEAAILGGSALAGVLGGGSAAGAVTGIHITEKAKWKGTGRNSKDKHQKTQ